jgi:sugar phosphate isomerase/epimerase
MMVATGLGLGAAAAASEAADTPKPVRFSNVDQIVVKAPSFRYCFNTATIMGQNLPLEKEVEIAAKAGYRGFEPWVRKIEEYRKKGGSLADMKKRIADLGLSVEGAIGFAGWLDDDEAKRKAGLEQMKRDMDLVAQIGGKRIAAPPVGATNQPMDLLNVAERYRVVLEVGREAGIVPQLELWGRSKTLSRLGEVAFVLVESAHPDACTVLDVFHVYRGGSDLAGLRMFNGSALHVFHINDYPADPPREKATDGDRVFPGDGVAPMTQILRDLRSIGFHGFLSLELFNKKYFQQDPLTVARTGLEKMKACVGKALG